MKKLLILSLLFSNQFLPAQNALMDAWELRDAFVKSDKEGEYRMVWKDSARMADFVKILMKYNPSSIQTSNQLEKTFEENPILFIQKIPQSSFKMPDFSMSSTEKRKSGAPGLSIASAADGLAKFLVKRTKEELTLSFFSQFQNWLEKNREFETVFPTTYFLMVDVNSDVFDFNHYLDGLRSAFIKDMKVLPTNLQMFVRTQKTGDGRALALAMDDLLSIGQAFVDERRPYEIFQFLASEEAAIQQKFRVDSLKSEDDRKQVRDLAGALRLTNILSESLRNTGFAETMWMDKKTAVAMLNDDRVRHIFLGLVWQQSMGLEFSNGFSFRKDLEGFTGKMARFETFMEQVRGFLGAAESLEKTLASIAPRGVAKAETGIVYDELDRYFNTFTRLMDIGFRVYLRQEKRGDAQSLTFRFARSMRWVKELYFDARQSNYTSVVADASFLLTEIYGEKWPERRDFLRYGNFMATVSEARSSDEMAAAIESFAYPAGSSRLKKHSQFSVGLNAYPGLGLRTDVFGNNGNSSENSFFIPASLGFAINSGLNRWGSVSFYAPIIDVGALFAFRFKDNSTDISPQVKWENIVAPGGYIVYGVGRDLPLAIGVGGQFSPSLKKVLPDGSVELDGRRRLRPNLFLTVDIPITHFYTR